MDNDGREVRSLVLEKKQLEAKLKLAGGEDFSNLLEDCSDLAGIIDEIEEVSRKMHEKEHAAFDAKVKFSRKVRRKAKDLNNFEQHLVKEYEGKHITLEHGRKMVSIIKLLRSKNTDKARREAEELYDFLGMGSRLEIIDDLLLKKRAQFERARRGVEAQLSGLEWLEKEPPVDDGKVKRHGEWAQLNEKLSKMWLSHIQALKSMPLCKLLGKMKEEELGKIGFPALPSGEAGALSSFLQKNKLEESSAEQLYEMAGQSEQRLRHTGVDLPLFRQEIVARRNFLFGIMSLHTPEMNEHALARLSASDENARKLAEQLTELGKTKEADEKEWSRAGRIKQKREELAGEDKAALEKTLQGLRALQEILDGKAEPEETEESKEEEKGIGLIGSFLKFLGKRD